MVASRQQPEPTLPEHDKRHDTPLQLRVAWCNEPTSLPTMSAGRERRGAAERLQGLQISRKIAAPQHAFSRVRQGTNLLQRREPATRRHCGPLRSGHPVNRLYKLRSENEDIDDR